MLKSLVDVREDLCGALERGLPDWHDGHRPIVALFASRTAMPHKTRVFLDDDDVADHSFSELACSGFRLNFELGVVQDTVAHY